MNAALPEHATQEVAAWDNPMGLMGFEFVEFTSPTPGVLEAVFEKLGFTEPGEDPADGAEGPADGVADRVAERAGQVL